MLDLLPLCRDHIFLSMFCGAICQFNDEVQRPIAYQLNNNPLGCTLSQEPYKHQPLMPRAPQGLYNFLLYQTFTYEYQIQPMTFYNVWPVFLRFECYSKLRSNRADQNTRVGREDFLIYYMKSTGDNFFICYMKN